MSAEQDEFEVQRQLRETYAAQGLLEPDEPRTGIRLTLTRPFYQRDLRRARVVVDDGPVDFRAWGGTYYIPLPPGTHTVLCYWRRNFIYPRAGEAVVTFSVAGGHVMSIEYTAPTNAVSRGTWRAPHTPLAPSDRGTWMRQRAAWIVVCYVPAVVSLVALTAADVGFWRAVFPTLLIGTLTPAIGVGGFRLVAPVAYWRWKGRMLAGGPVVYALLANMR